MHIYMIFWQRNMHAVSRDPLTKVNNNSSCTSYAISYISVKKVTINWNCNSMFFHAKKECGTSAHTLKGEEGNLINKVVMWFTFLKKPFPRTVHATYHQATNLSNLEEMRRLMLDYRKRKGGCSISKQYRRAQLYHWQSCKMQ